MRTLFFTGLLASVAGHATILYQFSFTPLNGPFQATTFTISSPTYLGVGNFSFTPFTVSDGTNTFTMNQGAVGSISNVAWCLDFGTTAATVSPCFSSMTALDAPVADFSATFSDSGSPPSAPGTFNAGQFAVSVGAFTTQQSALESSQGTVSLIVTDTNPTPEPTTAGLVGGMFLAGWLFAWLRKRARHDYDVRRILGAVDTASPS